uniref:Uncharacterized protein n=1 Tax=Anguilla anguilla TaxID=7936 RepID=A0A0E9VN14_ANGAN
MWASLLARHRITLVVIVPRRMGSKARGVTMENAHQSPTFGYDGSKGPNVGDW